MALDTLRGDIEPSELATVADINEARAAEVVAEGRGLRFGDGFAVVGVERSLLIGEGTRDVFLATPPLIDSVEAWQRFEGALYGLEPLGRLRVHGSLPAEVMEQLGFHRALFHCEKTASGEGGDVGLLTYRQVTTAVDRAFVRQCAALSVYQGMAAAYPGTPITPQRLGEYLDNELDFEGGKARSIIAWQDGYPVAHATWVQHTDPITGEPYVEMWDVDGLWDLRRTGILAQTATMAEHYIAAADGPKLVRGTVTIEAGWERIWASLERLGWVATTDLWVKYPWKPAETVIDLTEPRLRPATPDDLAGVAQQYQDADLTHLQTLISEGSLLRHGPSFFVSRTEWSPMIGGRTRVVYGLGDEVLADERDWANLNAALFDTEAADRLWVWGNHDLSLMESRGFTHLVTEMGTAIRPGPKEPLPPGLVIKMMDSEDERQSVLRLMRQAVVNGMTATSDRKLSWDDPEVGEYVDSELDFDDPVSPPRALIGYEDGEIFGCAVWLAKVDPVTGRPYQDVWDFYLKEGFFGKRLTRLFIETAQWAVASEAGGPVEIWANVVIDRAGIWRDVLAKLEHLGFSPKRHLFSMHPWLKVSADSGVNR